MNSLVILASRLTAPTAVNDEDRIYLKLMPDYKEMDQSTWVCYQLADKSYYYG